MEMKPILSAKPLAKVLTAEVLELYLYRILLPLALTLFILDI
jgi:hypothetical protein